MKLLNKSLITLVSLLLLFSSFAFAEAGGDLNLTNKASLSSRTGYNLNLSTQGSSDSIDFIIAGTSKGKVTSSGLTGLTLSSPTISGNLTFSTAVAKIIPGATSLSFRNNADTASNLAITDAGVVSVRSFLSFPNPNTGIDGSSMASGNLGIYSRTAGAIDFYNGAQKIWSMTGTSGALTQDATNGGDIVIPKFNTGIIAGAASLDSDVTSGIGIPSLFSLKDTGSAFNIGVYGNTATTVGPYIVGGKTRSASGADANTIVVSGDELLTIRGYGADGASYQRAAQIVMKVDGTPGSADMPGSIDFQVSPDGSATPASALKISNSANIVVSQTLTSTRTTDFGWAVANAANQACNTTCVSACVVGMDTGALGNFVACTDATADTCLCAGAS